MNKWMKNRLVFSKNEPFFSFYPVLADLTAPIYPHRCMYSQCLTNFGCVDVCIACGIF